MPLKNTTTTTNVDDTQAEVGLGVGVSANVTGNASDEVEEEADYRPRTELSLLDVEKKKAYESEVKKNNAKRLFWHVLIFAIPAFLTFAGIVVAIYTGTFTYYLKEVSQPLGGIQSDVNNLKSDIGRLEQDIRDLRNTKNGLEN